jgi:drug/metabolite transporter (DMT)-like permease
VSVRLGVRDRVERAPALALAVAVVAVSTSAILVRYSRAPESVVAFYRVLFMTALVAPFALKRNPGAIRALSRRDLAIALATGAALAVHFFAWFASIERTSVAASVTLVQSQPVFVAVGAALLLGEAVDRWTVAGILIALVGAAAMSLGEPGATVPIQGEAMVGNALAVLGAVMMAGYVLVGRSLRQRIPLFPYVTVVYGAATVVLFGVVLVRGVPMFAYPPREFALFLAMAVGPGVFGHTVVNWTLEHVESSFVSVTLLGEPVGSTVLAAALLSEVPAAVTVAGGCVVLGGIYLTSRARG